MKTYRFIFIAILFGLLAPHIIFSQPKYKVKRINGMQNAYSINNKRQVAGYIKNNGSDVAARWENGSIVQWPQYENFDAQATCINNEGEMAGASGARAILYKNDMTISVLPNIGILSARADGINDSGDIVGAAQFSDTCSRHAAVWQNGNFLNLGTLAAQNQCRIESQAFAINSSGIIVGSSQGKANPHAFKITAGIMVDLTPPGMDQSYSQASDINDSSVIAGFFGEDPLTQRRAVIWNPSMTEIQTLEGISSYANGINNSNQVVGNLFTVSANIGFLWENGVMKNLNTLIEPDSGWQILHALDINDDGDILANAIRNGTISLVMLYKNLQLTSPADTNLWIAGEPATIKWSGGEQGQLLQIEYSLDGGSTYNVIDFGVPGDTGRFVWNVPDNILTTKAKIKIFDMTNNSLKDESREFKIKGYVLTRFKSDTSYEQFMPNIHGWSYLNGSLWPVSWYSQFDYAAAVDPFTGDPYPVYFNSVAASEFPDWPLWVEVFSEDKCYWSTFLGIYNHNSQLKWKSRANPHMGSCFGFAASSFLAFNFRVNSLTGIPVFQTRFPSICFLQISYKKL